MVRLSELRTQLDQATLRGDDVSIQGVTEPGRGNQSVAEIWLEGEPTGTCPMIVDSELTPPESSNVLLVDRLSDQLGNLLDVFCGEFNNWGIDSRAELHDDVQYTDPVYVGPFVEIGPGVELGSHVRVDSGVTIKSDTTLGDGVHLHSGVKIVAPTEIGSETVIHSNTVVGSDGYGYDQVDGRHEKIPQIGSVEIGENVEIGANCAIDRGTYGVTEIGSGTKMDNQVHVAHNSKIGEDCLLVAKSGTAGSAELKDRVWIGGQSAVREHVTLAEDVKVAGRSGVTKDVTEEGKIVSGFPARDHQDVLKQKAVISKLPKLRERLRKLEQKMNEIEAGNT